MEVLKLAASLTTREPQVLLDPELKPGRYRVALVIAGSSGESAPAELRVTILKPATTDGGIVSPVRPTRGVVAPISAGPEPAKPKSRRKPK